MPRRNRGPGQGGYGGSISAETARLSDRDREVCARCKVARWRHERGPVLMDHDFVEVPVPKATPGVCVDPDATLRVLLDIQKLWRKAGLSDDPVESEEVYLRLTRAIAELTQ